MVIYNQQHNKTPVQKYGQLISILLYTQPQINTSIYPTIKICLFATPQTQKIRGPGFTSKPSENPYISSIFTLLIMYFSQQNHRLHMSRHVHFDVSGSVCSQKQIQPNTSEHIGFFPRSSQPYGPSLIDLKTEGLLHDLHDLIDIRCVFHL